MVSEAILDASTGTGAEGAFLKGLQELGKRQYSQALQQFSKAAEAEATGVYDPYYKAFYLMNRGVLRAEMIEFIASFESNVQTLTMDDQKNTPPGQASGACCP